MDIIQGYSNNINETNFTWIDLFDIWMSDEEILELIQSWKKISQPFENVIKEWEINHNYYIWNTNKNNSDFFINNNRIYTSVKTIIPMVTSKPAEPVVYAAKPWDEKSENLALQHQKLLKAIYESKNVQKIIESVCLHNLEYKIWFIMYWIREWEIYTDVVHPKKIIIDMEATSIEDAEFIWVKNMFTAKSLIDRFSKKESEIKKLVNNKLWSKIEVIEWFTDENVIVTCKDIVLKKMKNPHFNFEWKDMIDPETWEIYTLRDVKKNYFKQPKKPFIILNVDNDWTSIIDSTSPISQARPLQDNINRIKQNIAINTTKCWNPILTWIWFDENQIDEITNNLEVWDVIWLSQEQDLKYLQASPLPNFVSEDLNHSITEIDNIFWTHWTSRWEREARESAAWRQILRQWDEDTQAPRWRAIERILSELYNAWTQLIKVHYTQEEVSYVIWDVWSKEYIKATAKWIEDWIQIRVLPWSTIPDDKITKINRALQLAQLWLFPRELLFKELWYENYKEIAIKLDEQDAIAQMRQQEIAQQEQERQQNAEVWNQSFAQVQEMIAQMQ